MRCASALACDYSPLRPELRRTLRRARLVQVDRRRNVVSGRNLYLAQLAHAGAPTAARRDEAELVVTGRKIGERERTVFRDRRFEASSAGQNKVPSAWVTILQ